MSWGARSGIVYNLDRSKTAYRVNDKGQVKVTTIERINFLQLNEPITVNLRLKRLDEV